MPIITTEKKYNEAKDLLKRGHSFSDIAHHLYLPQDTVRQIHKSFTYEDYVDTCKGVKSTVPKRLTTVVYDKVLEFLHTTKSYLTFSK